jgi:hypothetical protein
MVQKFNGKYINLDNQLYHADCASGSSAMKQAYKSPRAFLEYTTAPAWARKETNPMAFGTAFHAFLLEPEKFKETYVAAEKVFGHYGLKDAKAYFKKFEEDNPGKEILKVEEMWLLNKMRESVMALDGAEKLLEGMETEVSYFGTVEGLHGKARLDFINPNVGLWGDFKTMATLDYRTLQKTFWESQWALQFAWYKRVVLAATGEILPQVCVLCVEKSAPFSSCIAVPNDDMAKAGEAMLDIAITNLKKALCGSKETEFPSLISVAPPSWGNVKEQ